MPEPQSSAAKPSPQAKPPQRPPRIIAPPATAESPRPPTPPPAKEPPKESIKETIESILVAFILAFVFRAFIVEAFVIPTGSMAPTLLGAHMRFTCEECGYPFNVNFPTGGGEDINIPSVAPSIFSMHCPNCGYKVPRISPSSPIEVYYGDRILTLKYLYLIQEPARWDVVVFKSPSESTSARFVQNFIKRLTGKPGETLMVLNGDVYACPNEKATKANGPIDNWPWTIQTKPREVQNALWRIVFDQDFLPQNGMGRERKWVFPWRQTTGTGWTVNTGGRTLDFANPIGDGKIDFVRDANVGTFPFTDWLPYNETMHTFLPSDGRLDRDPYHEDQYAREQIPRWHVSDLKIQFAYRRDSGDGPLRATLTKLGDAFVAELTPGKARLLHVASGSNNLIGEANLTGGGDLNVEFTNVDYQVTLRINGRDLIRTTPAQYHPDLPALLKLHRAQGAAAASGAGPEQCRSIFAPPRVELSAERQTGQITHLSLWRDIFYTPGQSYSRPRQPLHASPENPIRLSRRGEVIDGVTRDNEYFVLGDNSILSSDARYWSQPVDLMDAEDLYAASGRVPERFMLGKAFFVYWPAGFRFTPKSPGIIPNFGDMRFIH